MALQSVVVAVYQLARDERLGEAALPSLARLIPEMLLSRTLRSRWRRRL